MRTNEEICASKYGIKDHQLDTSNPSLQEILSFMAEAQREALEAYFKLIAKEIISKFGGDSIKGMESAFNALEIVEKIDINQFINGGKK